MQDILQMKCYLEDKWYLAETKYTELKTVFESVFLFATTAGVLWFSVIGLAFALSTTGFANEFPNLTCVLRLLIGISICVIMAVGATASDKPGQEDGVRLNKWWLTCQRKYEGLPWWRKKIYTVTIIGVNALLVYRGYPKIPSMMDIDDIRVAAVFAIVALALVYSCGSTKKKIE